MKKYLYVPVVAAVLLLAAPAAARGGFSLVAEPAFPYQGQAITFTVQAPNGAASAVRLVCQQGDTVVLDATQPVVGSTAGPFVLGGPAWPAGTGATCTATLLNDRGRVLATDVFNVNP